MRIVSINSKMGIHARPASRIIAFAQKQACEIFLVKEGRHYNAKSIMNILSMGVRFGEEIGIVAEGPNNNNAIEEMARLLLSIE